VTLIMGVLNVTPDSFSDGGYFEDAGAAIEHGAAMAAQGAAIVDVGGESTRPGASRVPVELEQRRVLPVIRELVGRGVTVSIDTLNAGTAAAAADAGASYINDVSGGLADPAMSGVVVDTGLPYIVTHWRGHSAQMDSLARYDDAPREVAAELVARVDRLVDEGVARGDIIVDPGLGFAKTAEHNWQVLAHLADFEALGLPVLVGASRKRFLGALLPDDASVESRDEPTAIVSALAAQAGVWGVRVHDVRSTRLALDVVDAWREGGLSEPGGRQTPPASARIEQ
jgi:dihydropteroate synthase